LKDFFAFIFFVLLGNFFSTTMSLRTWEAKPGMEEMMDERLADCFTWAHAPPNDGDWLKQGNAHKEAGNALFENKRYSEAVQEYTAGLNVLKTHSLVAPEAKKLKIVCELNLAACGIKLEDCEMTLQHCQQVFAEPNIKEEFPCLYLKALFRKGQILRLSGDYRKAKRVFCEALALSPGDASIQQELTIINGGVTFCCKKQKEQKSIFCGVFDKMKLEEDKEEIVVKCNQRKRQRALLESGSYGGRPSKQKNPCTLLRNREYGNAFSRRDCVNIMEEFLPNSPAIIMDQYRGRAYNGIYSQDGSLFSSSCQDWNIRVYTTGPQGTAIKQAATIKAKKGQWTITDTAMSRDNKFIIYSSITPVVHLVNLEHACSEQGRVTQKAFDFAKCREFGSFGLWCLGLSADNREIISGSSDNALYIYDVEAEKVVLRAHGHEDDVNSVTYADSLSSNIIFTGSDDCTIKVWDRRCMAQKPAGVLIGHLGGITYIDSKGDGIYLVSNAKDQTAKLWDIRTMSDPSSAPPSQRRLMWDYRGMNYPGNPATDKHPHDASVITFRGHSVLRTLIRCRFSPASTTGQRYVYTGSADGRIYVYDLAGDVAQILHPKTDKAGSGTVIRDVSWHPYSPVITSTSWGGTVAQFVYTEKACWE